MTELYSGDPEGKILPSPSYPHRELCKKYLIILHTMRRLSVTLYFQYFLSY